MNVETNDNLQTCIHKWCSFEKKINEWNCSQKSLQWYSQEWNN